MIGSIGSWHVGGGADGPMASAISTVCVALQGVRCLVERRADASLEDAECGHTKRGHESEDEAVLGQPLPMILLCCGLGPCEEPQ